MIHTDVIAVHNLNVLQHVVHKKEDRPASVQSGRTQCLDWYFQHLKYCKSSYYFIQMQKKTNSLCPTKLYRQKWFTEEVSS